MGFDEERRFFVVSRALSAIGRDDVKEKTGKESKCLVTKTLKSVFHWQDKEIMMSYCFCVPKKMTRGRSSSQSKHR